MNKTDQFNTGVTPTWCPGCGAFGYFAALKQALTNLGLGPDEACLFYDIGCSSNMASFMNAYGFNGLHGRSLPAACGASLAHHKTPIISVAGDGGAFGEGLNHFMAACRANYNITFTVVNNQLYSLTTGQTSPTTQQGRKTKSTPFGAIEAQFNPLLAAMTNHASFVARGFALNLPHLTDLLTKAIKNPGFSFVDILAPCVTWNKKDQPANWYQERVYELDQEGYPLEKAIQLALEEPDKLPLGIFYKEKRPSYQDSLPQLKDKPLVHQSIKNINISELVEEFI